MTEVQCIVCRCWDDIEESDSTDIGCFMCCECLDLAADSDDQPVSSQDRDAP